MELSVQLEASRQGREYAWMLTTAGEAVRSVTQKEATPANGSHLTGFHQEAFDTRQLSSLAKEAI